MYFLPYLYIESHEKYTVCKCRKSSKDGAKRIVPSVLSRVVAQNLSSLLRYTYIFDTLKLVVQDFVVNQLPNFCPDPMAVSYFDRVLDPEYVWISAYLEDLQFNIGIYRLVILP
jgi:hypothetical protein